jgi:hypothetical protein
MRFTRFTSRAVRFATAAAVAAAMAASLQMPARAANSWNAGPPIAQARLFAAAISVANGAVLLTGGRTGFYLNAAELYDPLTNAWTTVASMSAARASHVGARLPNGNALVAGGSNGSTRLKSVEIFDVASQTWSAAAPMGTARYGATATVLNNGKILVVGGEDAPGAELYDPAANTWTPTAPMTVSGFRARHTAVKLADGRVLVAGGTTGSGGTNSAEIYNPLSSSWTAITPMNTFRYEGHQASLLPDGRVLVTGASPGPFVSPAEIYNPLLGTWTTVNVSIPRAFHTSTALPDGRILIAGGIDTGLPWDTYEIFDGTTNSFSALDTMVMSQSHHTATPTPGGRVLIAGGQTGFFVETTATQIFGANTVPTVFAGANQTVDGGPGLLTPVTLDASGSHDPDNDPLAYVWKEGATLLAATSSPTTLVALGLGSHTITLTVSDGAGGINSADVTITVQDTVTGPLASCQANLATANSTIQQQLTQIGTLQQQNAAKQQTIDQQLTQIDSLQQQNTANQQTLQQQADTIASLQSQLAAAQAQVIGSTQQNAQLTQQNAQLTQQNAQATQQNAQLSQQNAALTQQVNTLGQQNTASTNGISQGLGAIQQDFRTTFKNPAFVIPGVTPLDKLQHLFSAILSLNTGRKTGVYDSLR